MKIKSLVIFALLSVIGFSTIHSYIFSLHDNHHHHTATEYISDLDTPNNHDNLCTIHFEFHQSFVLTERVNLQQQEYNSVKIDTEKESYIFNLHSPFFKPPIV